MLGTRSCDARGFAAAFDGVAATVGHVMDRTLLLLLGNGQRETGGIMTIQTASVAARTYDNPAAWFRTPDVVTFASRSTQLTTDGNFPPRLRRHGVMAPRRTKLEIRRRAPAAGPEASEPRRHSSPSRGT